MNSGDITGMIEPCRPDVERAIRGCVTGLKKSIIGNFGAPFEAPIRCIPVTSGQWYSVLEDSNIEGACDLFDESVARILEVRRKSKQDVGRLLPGLAKGVVERARLIEHFVLTAARFNPPSVMLPSVEALTGVVPVTMSLVGELFEVLAESPEHPGWRTLADLVDKRNDHLTASFEEFDVNDKSLLYERALGLPSQVMAGDGLTMASRVAAAWAIQGEHLDRRLFQQFPHLLSPNTSLSDKARLHLTHLSVYARPLLAHEAAVHARSLLLRLLRMDEESCLSVLTKSSKVEPTMYFTHRNVVRGTEAFHRAENPFDRLRAAIQLYNPVVEGDLRRVARTILRLLGREIPEDMTLAPLVQQLAGLIDEPVAQLIASHVDLSWRNAIAHEQVWWDSEQQRAVLGEERVMLELIVLTALQVRAICDGFEAGIALALNDVGNPQNQGRATENEISQSLRLSRAYGRAGIRLLGMSREGTIVRLTVDDMDVKTMSDVLGAVIVAAPNAPEITMWEIQQSKRRPALKIDATAVVAVTQYAHTESGKPVVELPISSLPLVMNGLLNHDRGAAASAPIIALAAVNIVGEFDRLADLLSRGDLEATRRLVEVMVNTACAVDAAASVASTGIQRELLAFSRLIRRVHGQSEGEAFQVMEASMTPIALAFRSCTPVHLPWIEDLTSPDNSSATVQ
jgi:hypothetical protein